MKIYDTGSIFSLIFLLGLPENKYKDNCMTKTCGYCKKRISFFFQGFNFIVSYFILVFLSETLTQCLAEIKSMFPFYILWYYLKPSGFLMLSGGIKESC